MDGQTFAIAGAVVDALDPRLQQMLEEVHGTPVRPRCLCVPGGVEMYVARHLRYLVKRLPGTGRQHLPTCPAYEFDPACSGRAGLGNAVQEQAGQFALRVDFPWSRTARAESSVERTVAATASEEPAATAARRMGLRALTHFLWEEAGLHRWSPAMAGRRNQGVLVKYLGLAASTVLVQGVPLSDRLYVPEPFHPSRREELAQRRREKLAFLRPSQGRHPLAFLIGEFRAVEKVASGVRVWVRHLPDVPLVASAPTWRRVERLSARTLEVRDADGPDDARLVLSALIRAKSESVYELDAACLTLASAQWIPVDHHRELPLLGRLVDLDRRFLRPLRYDLRRTAVTPNVLLLDAGPRPIGMYVLSPFMEDDERRAIEAAIEKEEGTAWTWDTACPMPPFPRIATPTRLATMHSPLHPSRTSCDQATLPMQG